MTFRRKVKELEQQIEVLEQIKFSFETILNFAHLSENKSPSCQWARMEIREYNDRYGK